MRVSEKNQRESMELVKQEVREGLRGSQRHKQFCRTLKNARKKAKP